MPYVRDFVYGVDHQGNVGLVLKGAPNFDVATGFTAAHDILEHFGVADQGIKEEMLAFGSMLYLRAEGDYWCLYTQTRDPRPGPIMANDISRFVAESYEQGNALPDPGRTLKLEDYLEDVLDELAEECSRLYASEHEDNEFDRDVYDKLIRYAIGWIRKGYRKAARRWNIDYAYRRAEFFKHVEDEFDAARKHVDAGDMLRVSVNIKSLEVNITHMHESGYVY